MPNEEIVIEMYANGETMSEKTFIVEYGIDGVYDPGRTHGDPQFCYPSFDERETAIISVEPEPTEQERGFIVRYFELENERLFKAACGEV